MAFPFRCFLTSETFLIREQPRLYSWTWSRDSLSFSHRQILNLVLAVYISPRGEYDYEYRHYPKEEEKIVHNNCDQRGGVPYWDGIKAAQYLVVGAPVLWLLLTLFILTGFRISGVVEKPWVSRWQAAWRLVVAWINIVCMWGLLAYFTILRHRINVTAGHLDAEDE